MRDYAELVKALRFAFEEQDCGECALAGTDRCTVGQTCRFKDAADAIEELLARDVVPTDFHERCLQLEIRKRIELEKQMPHWISVEERLPEKHVEVLICTEDYGKNELGFANTAVWDGSEWIETWNRKESIPYVSNWMPLPEPPKEVE